MRHINKSGLEIIKKFEGFSSKPYVCPAGKRTIGYGHVILPNESFGEITRDQGEDILRKDVSIAENAVDRLVMSDISENQFSALVSFVFNIGEGNFKRSTLLRKLNDEKYIGAGEQFLRWIYAGEKVLPGLVKRREAERELFLAKDGE